MKTKLRLLMSKTKMIYTVYSSEADITFIMEDADNKTAVVGFYYGDPNEEATKTYYGKLVAEYE